MSEQTTLEAAAQQREGKESSTRYLVFSLSGEEYAVPLLKVKEVIALGEVTPVPYSPPHFKGIMNLRGLVISIIDLRMKFKMNKAEIKADTSIIILDVAPLSLGVVVDAIHCVLAVEPGEVQPTPDVESHSASACITGVTKKDKKLVLLLDIERTLSVEDLKAMKAQSAA